MHRFLLLAWAGVGNLVVAERLGEAVARRPGVTHRAAAPAETPMRLAAQRSTRSVLISLAVHVAAVAGIIWVTAPRREPSLYADETTRPATGGGGGGGGFVIPLAQALTAAQATEYVGRYSIATDGQPKLDLIISSVKEAANYAERWSLLVHEGGASPYRLLPFARDSFVVRGRRERRVVFARREGNVTGIELHVSDQIRRGEKRSVR